MLFVDATENKDLKALRLAAAEGKCGDVAGAFVASFVWDEWALELCGEDEAVANLGKGQKGQPERAGVALRLLVQMTGSKVYNKELNAIPADDIQGHHLDEVSKQGTVGAVLVRAMKRSLEIGETEAAGKVYDKLWAAHKECASRWKGAATYACDYKWCKGGKAEGGPVYAKDMDAFDKEMEDRVVEAIESGENDEIRALREMAASGRCQEVVQKFVADKTWDAWTLEECATEGKGPIEAYGANSPGTAAETAGSALRLLASLSGKLRKASCRVPCDCDDSMTLPSSSLLCVGRRSCRRGSIASRLAGRSTGAWWIIAIVVPTAHESWAAMTRTRVHAHASM